MTIPTVLRYSEEHVWVRVKDQQAVIGMTDFAQQELGDIVFVELPQTGGQVVRGEPFGSMESVKTVTELYSPLSGKVVQVNTELISNPGKVNESAYDEGWMIVITLSDVSELDALWSATQYAETYHSS